MDVIAAKQEAFEEANRLKNQFRSLDEDEIEFLDSVLESTRKEEERVRRETKEGLEAFRKQQEEADKKARAGDEAVDDRDVAAKTEEEWVTAGKKRKRAKEKEKGVLKGVKIRREATMDKKAEPAVLTAVTDATSTEKKVIDNTASSKRSQTSKELPDTKFALNKMEKKSSNTGLGLVALVDYGSDEDD